MHLLDTETGQFVEKDPARTTYAILSHTWDTEKGEQTYKQLEKIQQCYPPEPQAPHSRPGSPDGGTSPSTNQDRGGPPAAPPLLQPPHDSPPVITPLPTPSTPSKSWFTRRMTRLRRWCHSSSARSAPRIQTDSHASIRTPIDLPSSNGPPAPSNEPPATVSSDPSAVPPALQAKVTPHSIWDDPELSPKIRDACAIARKNGYRYIWIDSCCIDKSSSSELSEAINSMYQWYDLAEVCYAYLADVPPGDDHRADGSRFRRSRWFTRGWTLQELVAPRQVEFLSQDWAPIGSKHALVDLVESVTQINYKALLQLEPLDAFSVAQRLSWAANRKTTREEDRAYSLLGIFEIHMPTLYGEGDHAFRRLQEQIMQRIPDQSLFAWGDIYLPDSQRPPNPTRTPNPITLQARRGWDVSPSAGSPDDFEDSGKIRHVQLPASHRHEIQYSFTPYGTRAQFQMIPLTHDFLSTILTHGEVELFGLLDDHRWYLAILGCEHSKQPGYLLGRVCHIPPSETGVDFMFTRYVRVSSAEQGTTLTADLLPLSPEIVKHSRPHTELKTVYIPRPRPNRPDLLWDIRGQAYVVIKLVLLMETRNALRSRGYSARLRDPDPGHPTTHWLTLSKDEHTITVEFRHTLEYDGEELTIDAEVKMSGSCAQFDSAPDAGADQVDRRTVFWNDNILWCTIPMLRSVRLSAAGVGALTVDLGLEFAGTGVYVVRVDIHSDAPPASPDVESALPATSAVESAAENGREVEVIKDHSPSGVIDTEDEAGREVEAGGREMGAGEARDLEAASDEAGGEAGHGRLT